MLIRTACFLYGSFVCFASFGQGGDAQLRAKADELFNNERFAQAMPLYSQLVSLEPTDRVLNYRFGTCMLFSGDDKEKAIPYLKYAAEDPAIPALAWYYMGRAFHLNYRFGDALNAYQRFRGTGDKKAIASHPVDALEMQARNGQLLLNDLKDITVHKKVEVDGSEFFRYYDLTGIGGRIVVTPEELLSSYDKKSGERFLVYLPETPGPFYFSSYGRDGKTGRDIYRSELLPDGKFATPVRLAGFINTDEDEDFPVLQPDGKTFYFSSKGHTSMGGYDVFKSTFDRGMDVFGPPENLDFAVSTPDDDMFYVVDGSGEQACFASARSSSQDKVHVYRISTQQVPLTLTVLKGTFASDFDPKDRKAHIVVEDGLTREVMADVRTDINGSYIISLPRSGRYRFLVEAGPSGRTHAGIVEIPLSDVPRAYRQELTLVEQNGQERLMIKNYFEEPLNEDMIALALDEIKRRARLDVGQAIAPQDPKPVVEEESMDDVVQRAGFTGQTTLAEALRIAEAQSTELEAQRNDLEARSGAAYTLAMQAASDAADHAGRAAELVEQARTATPEQAKQDLMVEAAKERMLSRTANLKARAAVDAGEELDAEQLRVGSEALKAAARSNTLRTAVSTDDEKTALSVLQEINAAEKTRSGPTKGSDVNETLRRASTEKTKEAERLLASANSKRTEESELLDRIARMEREKEEAGGRAKKEELALRITGLREQAQYLHEEVTQAFSEADAAEKDSRISASKSALVAHLGSANTEKPPATEMDDAALGGLKQRIAVNEDRIGSLGIDQRYEAELALRGEVIRGAEFNWGIGAANDAVSAQRTSTQVNEQTTDRSGVETITPKSSNTGGNTAEPILAQATPQQGGANADPEEQLDGTEDALPVSEVIGNTNGERSVADPADDPSARADLLATTNGVGSVGSEDEAGGTRSMEKETGIISNGQEVPSAGTVPGGLEPEQIREGANETAGIPQEQQGSFELNTDQMVFILENRLAEMEQLRNVTKERAKRDTLDQRMTMLRADLERLKDPTRVAASTFTPAERTEQTQQPMDTPKVSLREFEPSIDEKVLVESLRSGHSADMARANSIEDLDQRNAMKTGLELLLVDSIDAETQRQLDVLDREPARAALIVPRLDRLRLMKQAGLDRVDRSREESSRIGSIAMEPSSSSDPASATNTEDTAASGSVADGATVSHNVEPTSKQVEALIAERYIAVHPEPTRIYHSTFVPRSKEVFEAIALRDQDLARMRSAQLEIDSLGSVLDTLPRGKAFDKIDKRVYKLMDDRMILRAEIGQRNEYIVREEMKASRDSLKGVKALVESKGISRTEPVLVMADRAASDAEKQVSDASEIRKSANRTEDIVKRDSLFREAYRLELAALADMDKAITLRNYVLRDDHEAGSSPTYAEVEERMFAPAMLASIQAGNNQGDTSIGTANDVVEQTAQMPATTAVPGDRSISTLDPAGNERYNTFLGTDTAKLSALGKLSMQDPGILGSEAQQKNMDALALEDRSVRLADQAVAVRDSAATVKKKDRESLLVQALRMQVLSDSLHQASVVMGREADQLEQRQRDAQEAKAFMDRLRAYYYLSNEEYLLVMGQDDNSRYFQAKVKAIEQEQAAIKAREQAAATKVLAEQMLEAATLAMTLPPGETRDLSSEEMQRAEDLNAQAVRLDQRSDSLSGVAQRLKNASSLNDGQAAVFLQSMDGERSSEVMALEQRTRRVEPMLAEARALAPAGSNVGRPRSEDTKGSSRVSAGTDEETSTQPAVAADQVQKTTTEIPEEASATLAEARSGVDHKPWDFPIPDELREDMFDFLPKEDRREAPIPIDVDMPQGLVYKVQIGAFRNAIPQELFNDMSPVMGENAGNGLVRYTAGLFTQFDNADDAKGKVRERGYRDAFVVAYFNGKRISIGEARAMQGGRPIGTANDVASTEDRTPTVPTPLNTQAAKAVEPTATTQDPVVSVTEPVVIGRPSTLANTGEEDVEALASYPATAEEVLATFTPSSEATAYYNDPTAAPAKQVETVKGLFFTVQVGVYSKPVALDELYDITPLNTESILGGKIRYTTGVYRDLDRVRLRKDEAVVLGVKDAFITAYLNGKRIPVREGKALLQKFGSSVLVPATEATP